MKTDLEGLVRQLNASKFRHPLLEPAEDEGDEWFKTMSPAEEAALPEVRFHTEHGIYKTVKFMVRGTSLMRNRPPP